MSIQLDLRCISRTFPWKSIGFAACIALAMVLWAKKMWMLAEYTCHGWWEEMGVSYLITSPLTRQSSGGRRSCFMFRENPEGRARGEKYRQSSIFDETGFSSESPDSSDYGRFIQFSTSTQSCHRHLKIGSEGTLAFNVTSQGESNEPFYNWICM